VQFEIGAKTLKLNSNIFAALQKLYLKRVSHKVQNFKKINVEHFNYGITSV
tara:strand:- start:419 stop:571 length:153 start_codon:yes stop_codon:yes gene_type:complete